VAQSREAPVYPESSYTTGYAAGGAGAATGGYPAAAASSAYGAPAAGGYATGGQQGGYSAQPGGNTGYYYYYYPVQEQKEASAYSPPKENYQATDSYGIDPLGIIAVLAVAGLVIAGLALLFPGWAYVRSDESVYYRASNGISKFLGMSSEDYKTIMTLVLKAIDGEDCVEKTMCGVGKLVKKKVKNAEGYLKVVEDYAPTSVAANVHKLRTIMKKGEECSKAVTCAKKKTN
jgi:hypothetical protein